MVILGIDLETTSLSVDSCDIVEIGVAKYDSDFKRIFNEGSVVIKSDKVTDESASINGLSLEFVNKYGLTLRDGLFSITGLIGSCDYVCAQNGNNFDKLVLQNCFRRFDVEFSGSNWIDTKTDLPFPDNYKGRSLVHMAADHGIYYPKSARHTALSDVITMLQILSQYDINEVVKRANAKNLVISMDVPFQDNIHAKDRRFFWDKEKKLWCKNIKDFQLDDERKNSKYEIKILE